MGLCLARNKTTSLWLWCGAEVCLQPLSNQRLVPQVKAPVRNTFTTSHSQTSTYSSRRTFCHDKATLSRKSMMTFDFCALSWRIVLAFFLFHFLAYIFSCLRPCRFPIKTGFYGSSELSPFVSDSPEANSRLPNPSRPLGRPTEAIFVSPWDVEYLPNPVIFPLLCVLEAGYIVLRKKMNLTTELIEEDASPETQAKEPTEAETAVGADRETLFKCSECGLGFATQGLMRWASFHSNLSYSWSLNRFKEACQPEACTTLRLRNLSNSFRVTS